MNNNYFRVGLRCVFFDDRDYESIERAWWSDQSINIRNPSEITLYRPIPMPGAWDVCRLVGLTRGEFADAIALRRAGRSAA